MKGQSEEEKEAAEWLLLARAAGARPYVMRMGRKRYLVCEEGPGIPPKPFAHLNEIADLLDDVVIKEE